MAAHWMVSASAAAALALSMAACSGDRAGAATSAVSDDTLAISRVLDDLHDAASKAQEERYFSLFTTNAVFLGTDATERWPIAEFRAYAHERFSQGKGWTYTVKDRHIELAANRQVAWFDEAVENAKYGLCRGTGVLERAADGWKISQYNLTVPVPNDLLPGIAEQIREFQKARK